MQSDVCCQANGYGHGLLHIAKHSKAQMHSVWLVLRKHCSCVLVVLLNLFCCSRLLFFRVICRSLSPANIQTVVHCEEQLSALENADLETPVVVWLKVDSKRTPLGCSTRAIPRFR
ncbi:alanine racemase [Vibrio chagasii]|nr:alanine racemase [Vibrio chagasii]